MIGEPNTFCGEINGVAYYVRYYYSDIGAAVVYQVTEMKKGKPRVIDYGFGIKISKKDLEIGKKLAKQFRKHLDSLYKKAAKK